jgi:hypothetical protein
MADPRPIKVNRFIEGEPSAGMSHWPHEMETALFGPAAPSMTLPGVELRVAAIPFGAVLPNRPTRMTPVRFDLDRDDDNTYLEEEMKSSKEEKKDNPPWMSQSRQPLIRDVLAEDNDVYKREAMGMITTFYGPITREQHKQKERYEREMKELDDLQYTTEALVVDPDMIQHMDDATVRAYIDGKISEYKEPERDEWEDFVYEPYYGPKTREEHERDPWNDYGPDHHDPSVANHDPVVVPPEADGSGDEESTDDDMPALEEPADFNKDIFIAMAPQGPETKAEEIKRLEAELGEMLDVLRFSGGVADPLPVHDDVMVNIFHFDEDGSEATYYGPMTLSQHSWIERMRPWERKALEESRLRLCRSD